jgi:hypothetical protein
MRILITTALLINIFFLAHSQSPERLNRKLMNWVHGKVIFHSGDTVERDFAYNPLASEGLLEIKDNDKILIFGPKHVKAFYYSDIDAGKSYYFLTFPLVNEVNGMTREYFLEVLHSNTLISLLGKKDLMVTRSYDRTGSAQFQKISNSYYKLLADMKTKKIYEMSKKNLYVLMADKIDQIESFAKENRLKFKEIKDYIQAIEYYSSLK